MTTTDPRVNELARRLVAIENNILRAAASPQLAHSSIDNGALRAMDDIHGETMQIGLQWDGTYTTNVQNGPTPPAPTTPGVVEGVEMLIISWDGTLVSGAILPMDFLRVDIHLGTVAGFTPTHANRVGSIVAPAGGEVTVGLVAGTYFVKMVSWTVAGSVSSASSEVEADAWPITVTTDGFAPPTPTGLEATPGIEFIQLRWAGVVNFDPVEYDVYASTSTGFTPGPTNFLDTTANPQYIVKRLPGVAPAPGDPDLRELVFDTPYYFKVIARDADGSSAASTEAVGNVFQIPSGYFGADVIGAREVISGSFTGDEFAGEVFIGSQFKTAASGQRVEWGINGIAGYRSNGTRRFNVPTNDTEDIFLDAQIVARGLQVTGGASFEGTQNEITKDASLNLSTGVTSPTGQAQMAVDYDMLRPDTVTQRTGALGTFALTPSEVSSIAYKDSKFNLYQLHNLGTRVWRFNAVTGAYDSHDDLVDWYFFGEVWVPWSASGISVRQWNVNGQLYVSNGGVHNTYTPLNPGRRPTIGTDGTNIFIAEATTANRLNIGYRTSLNPVNAQPLPAATTTVLTNVSESYSETVFQVAYGTFDGGTARYAVSGTGGSLFNTRSFSAAGNWLDEAFESPTSAKRGFAYDGTNFWHYGTDGFLYKHTSTNWPGTVSSTWWGRLTLADTAGTTHETPPGPSRSIVMKRRSRLKVTLPPVPYNGGAEDPNAWGFYAAVSPTLANLEPTNVNMWRQAYVPAGTGTFTTSALATTGNNPPTSNNFPGATPGVIRNPTDTLVISGDGTGKFASVDAGTVDAINFRQSNPTSDNVFWGPIIKSKSANQDTVANSTALVSDNHLFFDGEINAKYLIDGILFVQHLVNTGSTDDLKVGFNVPAGASYHVGDGSDVAVADGTGIGSTNYSAIYGTTSLTKVFGFAGQTSPMITTAIPFKAIIKMSTTAGVVTLRWAANALNASSGIRMLQDSTLRIARYA